MNLTDLLGTVARLGLDVLSMLLLVGWLYRRRLAAPEMTLVFTALNIGLFAAVTSIGSGHFPTGIGFGLFGLLSLVRLRSAAFTLKDVAYTFVALVLALVNGLPDRNLVLVVLLDALLLVSLWVVDETRSRTPATRLMRVTLDTAVTDLGRRPRRGPSPGLRRAAQRGGRGRRPGPRDDPGGGAVRRPRRAVRLAGAGGRSMFAEALPLDVSARGTVSLAEVLVEAPNLTRVDRKYLVDVRTAQTLVDTLPAAYRTLSIAGRAVHDLPLDVLRHRGPGLLPRARAAAPPALEGPQPAVRRGRALPRRGQGPRRSRAGPRRPSPTPTSRPTGCSTRPVPRSSARPWPRTRWTPTCRRCDRRWRSATAARRWPTPSRS